MKELNDMSLPEADDIPDNEGQNSSTAKDQCCRFDSAALEAIDQKLCALQDLFVRRLYEDKQKGSLIKILEDGASFAFVEPFLSDLILLIDRLEKAEGEFIESVRDELLEILERRDVKQIPASTRFDPTIHKAVRVVEDPNVQEMAVTKVIRRGYMFAGKVIRPTEVMITKPGNAGKR